MFPPATASLVPEQVPPNAGGVATSTFAGNVSTRSAVSVATEALGLANVMVSREVPPGLIVVGAKAFCTEGSPGARTVRPAFAATGFPPASTVESPPAGMVLV